MFLIKYLNDFYYDMVIETYEEEFLASLNEERFLKVYEVFKKYKFYFIEDIILKHLELFLFEPETIEKGLLELKKVLDEKFVYIMGEDMRYFKYLYKDFNE